jgi:hypothetical protein
MTDKIDPRQEANEWAGALLEARPDEKFQLLAGALHEAIWQGRKGATRLWHPIETAPKDGEEVLLLKFGKPFSTRHMWVGYWRKDPGCWFDGETVFQGATYWMRLPEPPEIDP